MKLTPLLSLAGRIAQSNLLELPLPYRLTFAVTDRCQAHCTMCNIWRKPVRDELSAAEIRTLFSKADHFSWINLSGGELFQRPDIREIMLSVVRNSRKLYVLNFPTNGFQTGEIAATVDAILHGTRLPRLVVTVSLDGPEDLHDRIRGLTGCWDHALKTFAALRERRSRRFSVYLGHTVQKANIGRFDATLQAADRAAGNVTADDFHFNLAHASRHYYANEDTGSLPDPAHALAEIDRIRAKRSPRLFDPVAFIERRYQRGARVYLATGRGPHVCQAAGASCFIDPTGTVYPCTVFNAPLGSLREHDMDLKRLWISAARSGIRERIRNGGCPGCWTPCEAYQTLLANLLGRKEKP